MRVSQRYIYRQILLAVLFVSIGFLALFFFFDTVSELSFAGRNNHDYSPSSAMLYVGLLLPSHAYELLPITVLIGSIYVMSSMAQSSEFTILRTSGLSPAQALRTLLWLGLGFAVLTFVLGDYVAPASERMAQQQKAAIEGKLTTGRTGAWMKERLGDHDRIVNVQELLPTGEMRQVRIFDFNPPGLLQEVIRAESATLEGEHWQLRQVERSTVIPDNERQQLDRAIQDSMPLATTIRQDMVSSALLDPDRMSTLDLYTYINHLQSNKQSAQSYQIKFWHKVFYPFSCLVMMMLALPFAYLHFRSGAISSAVFGGVIVGISFFLLNNVFGYIGNVNGLMPWLAALTPSLIYTAISLAAFAWLVRNR